MTDTKPEVKRLTMLYTGLEVVPASDYDALSAKVQALEGEHAGEAMYMALARSVIGRILQADAKCDPPTDVLLRLEAIIRERDQLQRDLEAARREPVSPDDERANPVWDLVIAACQQAWSERRDYSQSPTELIVDLINERDEARRELQRVGEMHVIGIKRALRAERREDDLIEAIRAALDRLHKNRPLWNGPQHECAAVLGKALRCDEEPQPTPQAGEHAKCAECGRGIQIIQGEQTHEPFQCQPHTITYFCSAECADAARKRAPQAGEEQ